MTNPIVEEFARKRKTYQKPHIQRVALVPKEAVLALCKTLESGFGRNTPPNCGTIEPCDFPES